MRNLQAAEDGGNLRRRFPDGTRTARAKALTRERQMARRAAGRDQALPVPTDQEAE